MMIFASFTVFVHLHKYGIKLVSTEQQEIYLI